MYTIRAQQEVNIRASCAQVFAVLTDYERYPQIFEQVRDVEVHSRDEGVCRVTFAVDIVAHLQFTLRLVEDSPTSLRWTLADANLIRQMSGSWTLCPTQQAAACTAAYATEIKLAGQIPHSVQQRLVTQLLPGMLEHVRRHAESRDKAETRNVNQLSSFDR